MRAAINNAFPTDTSDPYLNYLMAVPPNSAGNATGRQQGGPGWHNQGIGQREGKGRGRLRAQVTG